MSRWSASHLDAVQRAFDLLSCPPPALVLDPRTLPARTRTALPSRALTMNELKEILLAHKTTRAISDPVWRELVTRARRDGPAWVVGVTGLALPGLRHAARRLTATWHGDAADLEAELLWGFLDRLHTIDLDRPRVCGRLIDAASRAARRSHHHAEETEPPPPDHARSVPPQRPWDHPDWVLARAVAAAVINPEECHLIGATRLEGVRISEIAEQLHISTALATSWRRLAEHRLREAILAGELDCDPLLAGSRR
jgi:hypothetical protein